MESATRLKNDGNAAFQSGDYDKALSAYRTALDEIQQGGEGLVQSYPEATTLRRNLHGNTAATLLKKGDADGALEAADQVESVELIISMVSS